MSAEFPYTISYNGKILAMFRTEHDRDICLDALREAHPDCVFAKGGGA